MSSPALAELPIEVFADSADLHRVEELAHDPLIAGFTTNPTLMRRAGVDDYEVFAHEVLALADGRPVSFEVCAATMREMEREACAIASWGPNVFVKIPATDPAGVATTALVRRLARRGVNVNVTAVFTLAQAGRAADALAGAPAGFVSVFAGRIADTGCDPAPLIAEAAAIVHGREAVRLIWASAREVLNVFQAAAAGCDVITLTADLVAKLRLVGKSLEDYSLETTREFYADAVRAGYRVERAPALMTSTGKGR
jgi:transaldolase